MRFVIRPSSARAFRIDSQDMSQRVGHKIGLVAIQGVMAGDSQLALANSSDPSISYDEITVRVVPIREVRVRFYNLIDTKGRRGIRDPATDASVSNAALRSLVAEVNAMVGPQCGVQLVMSGQGSLQDLNVFADLENRVDIVKNLNAIYASDLDRSAQYHVAFVWGIEGSHARGITDLNISLMRTDLGPTRSITLAHELVHFLSGGGTGRPGLTVGDHDEPGSLLDLMHNRSPHGILMRKDRLMKIIHA